ncbi:hypothetical protein WG219_11945 [Ectopseudomonas mendocina]|uniref:Uncharacterized protein n=1 Tax=Ectopseudomonas mendocina TaxID=300 RepID=A0ABZ2RET0_ECTME
MKLSDDFDPRCLRTRKPGTWRYRLATLLAVIFIIFSIILVLTGSISLLNQPVALQSLNEDPGTARVMVFAGFFLFIFGALIWRRCRRSRRTDGLSLSPDLLKRRD